MDNNQIIYCANCSNCKIIKLYNYDKSTYVKKIKCSKSQWKYCSGKEKVYDFFSILHHRPDNCSFYDPMCESMEELKSYFKSLRNTMPSHMVIYDAKTHKEVKYG